MPHFAERWMTDLELSYIAGFFDGEGSAFMSPYKATKNGKTYYRVVATITQIDRSVLEWIRDLFGSGQIYSKGDVRIRECFFLRFQNRQAREFLNTIYPFVRVKTGQVDRVLGEWAQRSTHVDVV